MEIKKLTVVLGASDNEERYSNKAIKMLHYYSYPIMAIGNKATFVNDIEVITSTPFIENVHTITLYLSPKNQEIYYDYIISLKPKRIIFNPGTENIYLMNLAQKNGIQTIEACTLVLLSTYQY